MYDVIVVGSGAAGTTAARELGPAKTLILDVGFEAPAERLPPELLHAVRLRQNVAPLLIGDEFESLHNLERNYLSPKLKAPLLRFVTRAPDGIGDTVCDGFAAVHSFAKGGFANAWGAGVFRYDDYDLDGWPVTAAELTPFYDELTRYIGVSGTDDDLTPFFGSTSDLQPPLPLSRLAARFLAAYATRRASMQTHGIHMGRLRSAILTADHRGRPAHQIHNQEFFQPNILSIYHPGHTLAELRAASDAEYRDGYLVTRFSDDGDHVNVSARNLGTGQVEYFAARHLVLAAGALNTARLVLASNDDHATRLPVLDNALSYVPLVDWRLVGAPADVEGFAGAELCLVHQDPSTGERVQGTFYGLAAPLRGDLFAELPLSLRGNITALRYLVPALGMLQMFHPDEPAAGNSLSLAADQRLEIRYARRTFGALERLLIARFRRAGFLGAPGLVRFPMPGSSMHYAGPLPMRDRPEGRYQTDRYGRLPGSGRIRVVDGAAFPRLPSKNHTFTMMANAMRIARHLREHVA